MLKRRMDDQYVSGNLMLSFRALYFRFCSISTSSQKTNNSFFSLPGGKFLVDTIHLMKTTEKKSKFIWCDIWTGGISVNYGTQVLFSESFEGVFWIEEENFCDSVIAKCCTIRCTYTPKGKITYIFDSRWSPFPVSVVCFNALVLSRECLKCLLPFP